ncbi:MAG: efflux RND transporter periplasmic adaptor subunit [Gammaproteobacteria bacterium]|nr:efflux RND transporter periplasmic adaptor subunit [Gammaproteobacteria bacterium]
MAKQYLIWGLATAVIFTGCDRQQPSPPPPRPALVMVVTSTSDINNRVLVGEVRPRYESVQSFRINGKIIERKVETGSLVKKGQLLARLDPADTQLSAAAALAEVKSTEASQTLAFAEATRYRNLAKKNFVSRTALDTKEAELANANARLKEARARADVAINQAHYTDLNADRDGVITAIRAEPGQVVEAGESIAQIADTGHIDILVAVPESQISSVRVNDKVAIKLWAENHVIYPGVIREISPAADASTRTFNTRITVTQADTGLKLGMTAKVKLTATDESENVGILIPNSALTEINGTKTVWIIDQQNKAEPRTVSAGSFTENGVLITDGLTSGEKIAIAGVHTLIKDQPVTPVPAETP